MKKNKSKFAAIALSITILLLMVSSLYTFAYATEWTTTQIVSTESTEESGYPSLAVGSDGQIHIAWHDVTDYGGSGTDGDIFYKRFVPDSGWTVTEVVSKESTDDSYDPSLAVGSDGTVHIAWYDYTDYGGSGTDRDIFYKMSAPAVVSIDSMDPSSGIVGTTVSITGTIMTLGGEYWIGFDIDNSGSVLWSTETVKTGNAPPGSFTVSDTFTVPDCYGDYDGHPHWLVLRDVTASEYDSTYFYVTEPDDTPPSGSIVINGGDAWTTTESVTLSLTYYDGESGVSKVRYRNEGGSWSLWIDPEDSKAWTLLSGDGVKYVDYQVIDHAGNYEQYVDSITLDTASPFGSIVINGGDATTSSTSVILQLTYSDATSGVDQVRYSNDGVWDSESWVDPVDVKDPWLLTDGDGLKTVYYQIRDNAGLFSATHSDSIMLDTTGELSLDGVGTWYWYDDTEISSTDRGDVDGDGKEEIVTGGYFWYGSCWNAQLCVWDGETLASENVRTWYWTDSTQIKSVAVGDVDGDSQMEIVTGGTYSDGTRVWAQLCVWNGATLALENVKTWYWTSHTYIDSVAIADVDGDADMEIVTGGSFLNSGLNAQLCVWDGATLVLEDVTTWQWTSNTHIKSVAVGDVDGDADMEIVTGGYFDDGTRRNAQLCVWDGATLASENVRTWYWTDDTQIYSVAVGDVDGDSQMEIVTGGTYSGTRYYAQLCVWDGATLAAEDIKTWYWISQTYIYSVVVGDVDGDTNMEIVTGGRFIDTGIWTAQMCVWGYS